jgi:hypothetical protein
MAHHDNEPKIYGVVAEYEDPDDLMAVVKQGRSAGYSNVDAYSPFPIHGLAEAMGVRGTPIPALTLIAGLTGTASAFLLQYIGTVVHYPFDIAGRPNFSWPAYVPIMFELTILFAAFTAGISMILLNGLPMPYHSVMNTPNFERASSDRFFYCIESKDPKFDPESARAFLESMDPKPVAVSEVQE